MQVGSPDLKNHEAECLLLQTNVLCFEITKKGIVFRDTKKVLCFEITKHEIVGCSADGVGDIYGSISSILTAELFSLTFPVSKPQI